MIMKRGFEHWASSLEISGDASLVIRLLAKYGKLIISFILFYLFIKLSVHYCIWCFIHFSHIRMDPTREFWPLACEGRLSICTFDILIYKIIPLFYFLNN